MVVSVTGYSEDLTKENNKMQITLTLSDPTNVGCVSHNELFSPGSIIDMQGTKRQCRNNSYELYTDKNHTADGFIPGQVSGNYRWMSVLGY